MLNKGVTVIVKIIPIDVKYYTTSFHECTP